MAIAIKVGYFYHAPVSRNRRPIQAGLRTLLLRYHIAVCPCTGIGQEIISMTIAIKISHTD